MGILRSVASAVLVDRLLRGTRHSAHRGYPYGAYPPPRYGIAPRRRSPRRSGVRMVGPFPTYSTTTRRGNRVSVGGCCLPIPLTVLASAAGALTVRSHRRSRGDQR